MIARLAVCLVLRLCNAVQEVPVRHPHGPLSPGPGGSGGGARPHAEAASPIGMVTVRDGAVGVASFL